MPDAQMNTRQIGISGFTEGRAGGVYAVIEAGPFQTEADAEKFVNACRAPTAVAMSAAFPDRLRTEGGKQ